MHNSPMIAFGYKVFIEPDRPRQQLGEPVKKFLTPEQIADHNAWMLSFFGTTNWMKDGEYLVCNLTSALHMNPRTHERFKAAIAAGMR